MTALRRPRLQSIAPGAILKRRGRRPLVIMNSDSRTESISGLRLDLMTAKVLVWVASVGRDVELTSDAHIFFFDRYQRLADHHRRLGHAARAARLQTKADEHLKLGGGDGPPFAAAMGMPRPRRWIVTDAIGRHDLGGPKDAA